MVSAGRISTAPTPSRQFSTEVELYRCGIKRITTLGLRTSIHPRRLRLSNLPHCPANRFNLSRAFHFRGILITSKHCKIYMIYHPNEQINFILNKHPINIKQDRSNTHQNKYNLFILTYNTNYIIFLPSFFQ